MPCRSPLSVLLFSFSLAAADKLPPAAQIRVDFDRDVRPIFAASCYGCHGRTQQQSGLRLDRKIDALRGGDYGLVIVAGNSAQSKLILRLAGATPGVQMPPTGTLPPEQISILRAWIDQGAHFPDAPLAEAPPAPPLDPVVRDLFAAIRRDDLGAVRLLLARDPKLADARDGSGFTPLMFSAAYSSPGLVTLLLDHGASVNAASEPSGSRALAWAAGDPAKLRLLLSRGAQVNARSAQGRTPLLIAASQPGSAEAVRLLLDQGADPAIRDHSGNSPLAAAAATGDLEVMRLLLARGADVNAKTENGSTPLMAAARSREPRAVELLLARGADPNAATKRGVTALSVAAGWGAAEIVRMLLDKGARVDTRDDHGYTPLMNAAYSDAANAGLVKMLLAKGIDPDVSGEGETALSLARKRGHTAVVKLLSKPDAPAAPARAGHSRRSPLPVAAAIRSAATILEKQSPRFLRSGGCNSCHNQYLPAVAFALARERGFEAGEIAQMSGPVADLTPERFFEHGGVPGGAHTIGYLLFSYAALKRPADEYTDSLVHHLKMSQEPSGRWPATSNRPPMTYDDVTTTALALRAMKLYAPAALRLEYEKRVQRARAWLLEAVPQSTQERAFQLLGLHWSGAEAAAIQKAVRGLAAIQGKDGGWSQLPALDPDAYATGQAVYALREAGGLPASDAAIRRGLAFLLETQAPDGSWFVRTRSLPLQPYFETGFPYGHDQWISAAGTSWAILALASSPEPARASAR